ncbi:MAG: bifunctional phosphoserine phosphatase/homoserine phosphotransferase ThrH [Spirochaetales bacterium]|nr:bifunctional phosphoserine phosphatase/homoserine phosphotransferase ThrH [Spirochaetales bacterium]
MLNVITLDLEGVLVPEIWIEFSKITGIADFRLTTREVPDYDVLMKKRIELLAQHGLMLSDIQDVIRRMEPMNGAKEFLDRLRRQTQVVILSDTFTQFAGPLMEKLGLPTIFCNTLEVGPKGQVTGYRLRQKDGKKLAVQAFHSMGLKVFASGDSYNDTGMLLEADAGFFFCPPESITLQFPQIPVKRNYTELTESFDALLSERF